MKAKHALVLFSVVLAIASAAAIGSFMPENYWMTAYQTEEPGIAPGEGTIPVANGDLEGTPMAKVPLAQWPGHPGGIYTEVLISLYGSIKLNDSNVEPFDVQNAMGVVAKGHIAPDQMSGQISFATPTRDKVWVRMTIDDNRDDINTIYATVTTQPGVEVNIDSQDSNTGVFHVSPGVWLIKSYDYYTDQKQAKINVYIYGQPISSGDRSVLVTLTAE